MKLQDINVNAIPVFNDHKDEIFRKIEAGEELTNEEIKIKNDFIFLCESLASEIGSDSTKIENIKNVVRKFNLGESYKALTGEELILDEEKKQKM